MSYLEASVYLFIEYVNKPALNFRRTNKNEGNIYKMEYAHTADIYDNHRRLNCYNA